MPLLESNIDHRRGSGISEVVYQDFSGGLNDTATPIAMKDHEVSVAQNVDFSVDVKAFSTRKGCTKLNLSPMPGEATDAFSWSVASTHKRCVVVGTSLYELVRTPHDESLYDFTTETYEARADKAIAVGQIFRFRMSERLTGDYGHFYKARSPQAKISVFTEDFKNTALWEDVTAPWTFRYKSELRGDSIHPFTFNDRLYFTDGAEFYVWGDFDHTTETYANEAVSEGDVFRFYKPKGLPKWDNSKGWDALDRVVSDGKVYYALIDVPPGVQLQDATYWEEIYRGEDGHFYSAIQDLGVVTVDGEDFLDQSRWSDVTDVPGAISSVVRPVKERSSGARESYTVEIVGYLANPGTSKFGVNLDGEWKEITFASPANIAAVAEQMATKFAAVVGSDWTVTQDAAGVTFTAAKEGVKADAYIDYDKTKLDVYAHTVVNGAPNNNDLAPIRKCTMFVVHRASMRVFAAGNPDDNALYYSELGDPGLFNSAISKVYPVNGHEPVTGMAELSSSLIVSFAHQWYEWTGIDPGGDATWKQLNIPYGCTCHESIALTPYGFTYLAADGLYTVSASILTQPAVMYQGHSMIRKVSENRAERAIQSIADHKKCRGVFFGNAYWLAYNVLPGQKVFLDENETGFYDPPKTQGNTLVLKYEWDTQSFTMLTGWGVRQWFTEPGRLFFVSGRYALEANVGYKDVAVGMLEHTVRAEVGEGLVFGFDRRVRSVVSVKRDGELLESGFALLDGASMSFVEPGTYDVTYIAEIGEPQEIEVLVRTKTYALGSPFRRKTLSLAGFVFKQGMNVLESQLDIMVEAGYHQYSINGFDIPESLVFGRNWGKRWGFREQQVKTVEVNMTSDIFALALRQRCFGTPITLVCIGLGFRTRAALLPQDVRLNKDAALYRGSDYVVRR